MDNNFIKTKATWKILNNFSQKVIGMVGLDLL